MVQRTVVGCLCEAVLGHESPTGEVTLRTEGHVEVRSRRHHFNPDVAVAELSDDGRVDVPPVVDKNNVWTVETTVEKQKKMKMRIQKRFIYH